ncbi:hypothetical protein [Polaribacter sp.]|uniref:hypothetical protein n=1 Tax=Polaribacter sp. TaxID=1920175 RepID=UPI0025EA6116|nr:hypothetical protein [Polaribacter sp.]
MKKLLLLSLTILLFSCGGSSEFWLNTKRYNIPNIIKEQIRNADCEELEVMRQKFKLIVKKKNKLTKKEIRNIGRKRHYGIIDSLNVLRFGVLMKQRESKCRKKLKETGSFLSKKSFNYLGIG